MNIVHAPFIRRCLQLAEKGRGSTGINPMVGAVLVRDGKILAEGFHSEFGKPHAERQLLENTEPTNQSARSARFRALREIGSTDTLYVNLEPCCHTNKKTPPCTNIILERGVKKMVFGMRDPNPDVSGKGISFLRSKGIEIIGPMLEDECLRLNRGFVSVQTLGRPWITLHQAQTTEGRFANPDGSPLKITDAAQDAWSHQFLRARHDAILVGVNTILRDNPQLTTRRAPLPSGEGLGWGSRIILDPHLKVPLDAKVVNSPLAEQTFVMTAPNMDQKKIEELQSRGVRVLQVPVTGSSFEWSALWKILTTPTEDFHGITSMLIEGGPKTWEAFRKAGCVDQEVVLVGTAREK